MSGELPKTVDVSLMLRIPIRPFPVKFSSGSMWGHINPLLAYLSHVFCCRKETNLILFDKPNCTWLWPGHFKPSCLQEKQEDNKLRAPPTSKYVPKILVCPKDFGMSRFGTL